MTSPESDSHARWWPSAHGFPPGGEDELFVKLHVLLTGFGGRFPDSEVADFRDMVIDKLEYLPEAIVLAAIELNVALTRSEINMIIEISRGFWPRRGDPRHIDQVPLTDTMTDGGHRFVSRPEVAPDYANDPEPPGPPPDPAPVPNVVNLPVAEAAEVLRYAGFQVRVEGEGAQVTSQFPSAGVRVRGGTTVVIAAGGDVGGVEAYSSVTVPDLKGLSRQEAADRLARLGLRLDAHGEGKAVNQDPLPGARVPPDSYVRVEFQPGEGEPVEPENGSADGP